ncbi:MAG: N-6 DNA methylase [Nitrosarchaeum sp.]|nr:N-6 DNA methylase [Nitrosarchaeum sp.]
MKPTSNMESFLNGLIKKFNEIPDTSKYDKKKTASEFIIPLFSGLGWEFEGKNPSVIDVTTTSKDRADYSFEIDGITKFVLKIASIDENIDDKKWIVPVTTFAFNKGITWAIITNFKKIKILNSEVKGKTPMQMQFFEITFEEFISKYDRLAYLLKKSFELDIIDKEAEYFSKKQKKTPIDEQLLEDLLKFSNKLSYDIQKNNSKKFSIEEIDESVHKILNRLIFIRACGDRRLEQKHLITHLREWEETKDERLVKHLRKIFDYFEENYGGTIFSDHLCDKLEISNSILQEIIEGLYISEDKSIQYDFSIIESDVLGQMYEQYLRFFRTTDITNIETERKKQGIFYTPRFVVEYIVKNTLGKLIEGKKIDYTKIRILDPACGSGSFLIKAYDFLYHYNIRKDTDFHQTQLSSEIEGGVYSKKVQILKENLFGVDLDKIATEIIQLNLLLKITEKKRHLPILQQNIRHGNSIIEDYNIDPLAFVWKKEFHGVLENEKGFDIIIGNPPYVRQEKLTKIKPYLKENYQTHVGTADLFVYFIEKSLELLKDGGYLGIVVSNKWLKREYGRNLRNFLKDFWIEEIIDFGDLQIFPGATTYPCIIIIKKKHMKNLKIKVCNVKEIPNNLQNYVEKNKKEFSQKLLTDNSWDLKDQELEKLIDKIIEQTIPLKEIEDNQFYRGVTTGLNEAFVITQEQYYEIIKDDPKSKEIIFPYITGREVKSYNIKWDEKYIIFTRRGIDIDKYPAIKKHLLKFKEKLTPKKNTNSIGRKPGKYKWFEIQDSTAYWGIFLEKGIVYPDMNTKPNFAINDNNYFPSAALYQIKSNDLWLLSILNSTVIDCYMKKICPYLRGGYYIYKSQYMENVPIPKRKKHEDEIIALTEKLIQLKKEDSFKTDEIEKKLCQLIYDEYDLKQNDIEIIERNIH